MTDGRPGKRASHWYYLVHRDTIPPEQWAELRLIRREGRGPRGRLLGGGDQAVRAPQTKKEILKIIGTGRRSSGPPSVWTSEDGRGPRSASGRAASRVSRPWSRTGTCTPRPRTWRSPAGGSRRGGPRQPRRGR